MWGGYSVDRPGFYCPGGEVGLWTKDPMNRVAFSANEHQNGAAL
jgi:hypothetical protein